MASYTSSSVLVAEAAVLYAPTGTGLPDETDVAWNTFGSWTGWTMLGYTTTATTLNYSYETFEVDVQQSLAPILQRKINERANISGSLAQFEGAILAVLLQGTNTTTAAGASQKGWDRVVTGGDPSLTERMFALEGWKLVAGVRQPVRVFLYRGTITMNGDVPWDKAAVTALPFQITGLGDTTKSVGSNLMEMHIINAAATS
jgi:hypothetical protein